MEQVYNESPHTTKEDIIKMMEFVREKTYAECCREFKAEPYTEWTGEDGRQAVPCASLKTPSINAKGVELVAKIIG